MNVTLFYLNNKHNFDVYQSSSLSYFYEIASKVFQLHKNTVMLLYQNQRIPNDETIKASNFFKDIFSVLIQVKSIELHLPNLKRLSRNHNVSTDKDQNLNRNCLSLTAINPLKLTSTSKAKKKRKKSEPRVIICQLCEKQPSLFYCKTCNEFFCLECNTKYSEHIRHQLLEIENENYEQAASIYQKDVIREISVLDNAFKKSIDWTNIEIIRASCLNGIVSKLKDIDVKAQIISSSKVNKQIELSEQVFYTLKDFVLQLLSKNNKNKRQKNQELQRVFSDLNKKEKEIIKLISHVNLEVIKAKYNYKLLKILKTITNMLNELVVLSTNTQNDCALRNYSIEELNNFNDDYLMEPLEYFIATFDDSFVDEKEDITNLKKELKQDSNNNNINGIKNKKYKPLFASFMNPIEQLIHMNKTNTNTKTNTNSTHLNVFPSSIRIYSPNISNTNGNQNRNEKLTPKSNIKRRNSKYLKFINAICRKGCYSPKKNALNVYFSETNRKRATENEIIDSSHVNPFEGSKHQKKRRSKLKYSSDIFF